MAPWLLKTFLVKCIFLVGSLGRAYIYIYIFDILFVLKKVFWSIVLLRSCNTLQKALGLAAEQNPPPKEVDMMSDATLPFLVY